MNIKLKGQNFKKDFISFLDKYKIPHLNNIRLVKNGTEIWISSYCGKMVITAYEWNNNLHDYDFAEFIANGILSSEGIEKWYSITEELKNGSKN